MKLMILKEEYINNSEQFRGKNVSKIDCTWESG